MIREPWREIQQNRGEIAKEELVRSLRRLDDFPKIEMFVRSTNKIEKRWGIILDFAFKEKEGKAIILSWHGIFRANLMETYDPGRSSFPCQYPEFESMREANHQEYSNYFRRAQVEINKLLMTQYAQGKRETEPFE